LFLEAVLEESPDWYPIFLAAIHSGLRSGELAGLKWSDIDWNRRLITVRRIITNRGKVAPTKTNRMRTVDMSSTLFDELKDLKERQQHKWGEEAPEWIFANQEGNPPDMHNLKHRHFFKALDRAGIRRIRFHDLRHTFASLLIANGESLAYVRDQLGHSSIALTVNTYTHLIPGSNTGAVDRLPAIKKPEIKGQGLSVVKGKR
jgi:integrase